MNSITQLLLDKLIKYNRIDPNSTAEQKRKIEEKIIVDDIDVNDYGILKVRDSLFGLGTILEEDLKNQYYLTTVKIGFLDTNEAIAIVHLNDKTISVAAYATEGLISQNNAQQAIEKIKNRISVK